VIIAALSVSGPLERMGAQPGAKFGAVVVKGARQLSEFLHT
jgi:DNA-binding IclR family transcriptional regulator